MTNLYTYTSLNILFIVININTVLLNFEIVSSNNKTGNA